MRTLKQLFTGAILFISISANAQTINAPTTKIGVLSIDAMGMTKTKEYLTHITNLKLQNIEGLAVARHYDLMEELKAKNENPDECYGIKCISKAGRLVGAEQMLTGTIEAEGKAITVNYSLIDVESETIIRTVVKEFYNFPDQISGMITVSLNELFNVPSNPELLASLELGDRIIDERPVERLNLSGPRMGAVYVGGNKGERLSAATKVGGFDMLPFMSQFGFQFEVQYFSAGNMQALFEFIPLVSGLDQGRFVPSFTFMNGFRHNNTGWEFAFGPTISFARIANGFYDTDNNWKLENEWDFYNENNEFVPNPNEIVENYDKRGDVKFTYGFTIGAGKTFQSGQLNLPVNVFFTPANDGFHLGASFGFNVRKKSSQF